MRLAQLDGSDSESVTRLFERLSTECLYRRFLRPAISVEEFTAAILKSNQPDCQSVAAIEDDDIVGVAQYSRIPGSRTADLAILVADLWRRRGIGLQLVMLLVEEARARRIDRFAISIQLDNFDALRLLRRLAPRVRLALVGGGVGEATIHLDTAACANGHNHFLSVREGVESLSRELS